MILSTLNISFHDFALGFLERSRTMEESIPFRLSSSNTSQAGGDVLEQQNTALFDASIFAFFFRCSFPAATNPRKHLSLSLSLLFLSLISLSCFSLLFLSLVSLSCFSLLLYNNRDRPICFSAVLFSLCLSLFFLSPKKL